MPPSDKPITDQPVVGPTAVNVPPASAPGAVPAAGSVTTPPPMPGDAPKVDEPIVPGAAPVADVPTVGQTTDLPKPPEEETDTGNPGGVPPATTGM